MNTKTRVMGEIYYIIIQNIWLIIGQISFSPQEPQIYSEEPTPTPTPTHPKYRVQPTHVSNAVQKQNS